VTAAKGEQMDAQDREKLQAIDEAVAQARELDERGFYVYVTFDDVLFLRQLVGDGAKEVAHAANDFDALLAQMAALDAERTPGPYDFQVGDETDYDLIDDHYNRVAGINCYKDSFVEWIALASRFVPVAIAEIARLRASIERPVD
jgi:hypothetical protein